MTAIIIISNLHASSHCFAQIICIGIISFSSPRVSLLFHPRKISLSSSASITFSICLNFKLIFSLDKHYIFMKIAWRCDLCCMHGSSWSFGLETRQASDCIQEPSIAVVTSSLHSDLFHRLVISLFVYSTSESFRLLSSSFRHINFRKNLLKIHECRWRSLVRVIET